jgi:hypothetical protein
LNGRRQRALQQHVLRTVDQMFDISLTL